MTKETFWQGWHQDKTLNASVLIALGGLAITGIGAWYKTQSEVSASAEKIIKIEAKLDQSDERYRSLSDQLIILQVTSKNTLDAVNDIKDTLKQQQKEELDRLREEKRNQ